MDDFLVQLGAQSYIAIVEATAEGVIDTFYEVQSGNLSLEPSDEPARTQSVIAGARRRLFNY